MISIEELKELKKTTNFNLGQTEKDYFQSVILFALYKEFGKELVFKGGTCLTKCYGLDRFSEDLDFTLTKNIDTIKTIKKWLQTFQIPFEIKNEKELETGKSYKIVLQGPLYTGTPYSTCSIKIDLSTREHIENPTNNTLIRTNHPSLPTFEVIAMNKEEIAAEKIRAIMTRNKARDLYDLHLLNTTPNIDLINKKLSHYNKTFSKKELEEALENKRKIWAPELKNLVLHIPDFDTAKKTILDAF